MGWPLYCCDLKQVLDDLNLKTPKQEKDKHNALEDARWNKKVWEWVDKYINTISGYTTLIRMGWNT